MLVVFALAGCAAQASKASAQALVGTIDQVDDTSLTLTNLLTSKKITVSLNDATEIRSQVSQGGAGGGAPSETAPSGGAPDGGASDGSAPGGDSSQGQPPAKPDGESGGSGETPSGGDSSQGELLAKPDGANDNGSTQSNSNANGDGNTQNNGDASDNGDPKSNGEANSSNSSENADVTFAAGDKVFVLLGNDNTAMQVTIMSNTASTQTYQAQTTVTDSQTFDNQTLSATGTDENVVLVGEGGDATISSSTITRTSNDSTGGDNASFYGAGAAILAAHGRAEISSCNINTDAKGGAGVFSYGPGVAVVTDTNISTSQNQSGGIHVAGGGTLYATNVNAETQGENSAAIRSDRGSGSMIVNQGSFLSHGKGSPALYSTADIYVQDAFLEATDSEALCIEGLNSAYLKNCSLTGAMPTNENDDLLWNVILYQSMSGDSNEGESHFTMDGGTLTAHAGGMFYTTNTDSEFVLKGVDINYSSENPFLLRCTGNANKRGWGSTGSNGTNCTFTGISQSLKGDVIWDSISNVNMYLTEGSQLEGAFVQDETYAGNGGSGTATLTIDADSTWIVTGNSKLTTLNCAGTIEDAEGKSVTIVDAQGNVLQSGDSDYTVTVDSYNQTADLSGAGAVSEAAVVNDKQ